LKESDFVVTSSFHGVVFSVVFRKPFYAILWGEKYKSLVKQNGRIIDLSRKLGLEDRCFDNLNEIIKRGLDTNIDWQEVHEKLNVLRKDSIEWLLRALEGGTKDGK
jgi:polysaccharide pyruvyl transferase WcaK-like protein